MPRKNAPLPLEIQAFNALLQSCFVVSQKVVFRVNPSETLKKNQYQALETLYANGPLNQRQIAAQMGQHHSNMTVLIDSLEEQGLARRVKSKNDRRFYLVELTPDGKKCVKKLLPKKTRQIADAMGSLNDTDLEHLKRICSCLIQEAE